MFDSTILNASAGAGKTRAIVYKIKELLIAGVSPSKIMCISFTKNASENIMKRLAIILTKHENYNESSHNIDPDCIHDIKFHTVHSFCYFILKKFVKEIPHGRLCETYSYNELLLKIPVNKYSIIQYFSLEEISHFISQVPEEIITQCSIKGMNWYKESLTKIFNNYINLYHEKIKSDKNKKELLNPNEILDVSKLVLFNSQIVEISLFLRNNRIFEKGIYLFDDLVAYAYKSLYIDENREWITYSLCKVIDHIFIDESQDISPIQWKVLLSIINEVFHDRNKSFFIAGDEKQSIFSFQNADFEFYYKIIQKLEKESKDYGINLKKIEDNSSARTPKFLVQVINNIFNNPNHIFPIPLQLTKKKYNGSVTCMEIVASNQKDHALGKQIAKCISEWLKSGKYINSKRRKIKASDIMILFRKRGHSMQIVHDNLIMEGIESSGVDKMFLFSSPCARFIVDFMKLCIDPTNEILLMKILQNYPFFLEVNPDDETISIWDIANKKIEFPLQSVVNSMCFQISHLTPHNFLFKIFFEFEAYYKLVEKKDQNVVHEMLAMAAQSQYSNIWNFVDDLPKYIKQYQTTGVKLSTIHAAKGMQAPIIIVADSTYAHNAWNLDVILERDLNDTELKVPIFNTMFPSFFNFIRSNIEKKRVSEFYRELYVALTRAEDEIYFTGWKPILKDSWYNSVKSALKNISNENTDSNL